MNVFFAFKIKIFSNVHKVGEWDSNSGQTLIRRDVRQKFVRHSDVIKVVSLLVGGLGRFLYLMNGLLVVCLVERLDFPLASWRHCEFQRILL